MSTHELDTSKFEPWTKPASKLRKIFVEAKCQPVQVPSHGFAGRPMEDPLFLEVKKAFALVAQGYEKDVTRHNFQDPDQTEGIVIDVLGARSLSKEKQDVPVIIVRYGFATDQDGDKINKIFSLHDTTTQKLVGDRKVSVPTVRRLRDVLVENRNKLNPKWVKRKEKGLLGAMNVSVILPTDDFQKRSEFDDRICPICGRKAKLRCTRCKAKFYCSKECQALDWKNHKPQCKKVAEEKASVPPSAVDNQIVVDLDKSHPYNAILNMCQYGCNYKSLKDILQVVPKKPFQMKIQVPPLVGQPLMAYNKSRSLILELTEKNCSQVSFLDARIRERGMGSYKAFYTCSLSRVRESDGSTSAAHLLVDVSEELIRPW